MSDSPITTATDAHLGAAVEDNLFALFRAMTVLPGSQIVETGALSYHLTSPTNPMYKGVWRSRLSESDADAAIDRTIAWFKERYAPFMFWWTGPGTTPGDLGHRLESRGLVSMEAQTHQIALGIKSGQLGAPGMAADLKRMNEASLKQVPQGFTIREVTDEASLADFKSVLISGYEIPPAMADGWVQAARGFGIGRTPWKMYLGRLDGKPVATNMVLNGGGVAGVYGVAVVPSARGKGIGGAITLAPLLESRAAGYRYSVLFSTDMAIRAYERIGFHDCGVRINRYLWRNAQ